MRCPIANFLGGFECVDILNSLDSCGGCVDPQNTGFGGGFDCSTIDNVDAVRCSQGRCEVQQCRRGFKVSARQDACVVLSHSESQTGRLVGV